MRRGTGNAAAKEGTKWITWTKSHVQSVSQRVTKQRSNVTCLAADTSQTLSLTAWSSILYVVRIKKKKYWIWRFKLIACEPVSNAYENKFYLHSNGAYASALNFASCITNRPTLYCKTMALRDKNPLWPKRNMYVDSDHKTVVDNSLR